MSHAESIIISLSYSRRKLGNTRGNLHFSVGEGVPSHSLRIFNHIKKANIKFYMFVIKRVVPVLSG